MDIFLKKPTFYVDNLVPLFRPPSFPLTVNIDWQDLESPGRQTSEPVYEGVSRVGKSSREDALKMGGTIVWAGIQAE